MTKLLILLGLHVVLLVLASTSFTIVPGFGDGNFQWEYFRYLSKSGWGVPYEFPYTLPIVLTYVAAYAAGVAAYCLAYRSGLRIIGLFGMLLCTVGFASFSFELSHWFVDHNSSWIASMPIAILPLTPAAAIRLYWIRQAPVRRSGSPKPSRSVK